MSVNQFTLIIAFLALAFAAAAFGWRLRILNRLSRPADRATPKGNPQTGVVYAYTLGMAPWAKESTRRHWAAYLRGVAFHAGIFLGLGILVLSPWISSATGWIRILLAAGTGFGAIFGLIGLIARFVEPDLKSLSTNDDFIAVLVVSLFLASACLWLLVPPALPVFYLVSGIMLVYAPFSKIRHCIYFAYSRLFFGKFFGTRAVLPHKQQSGEA